MLKKVLKSAIGILLIVSIFSTTCMNAFAASFTDKTYVKEVFLSYGNTDAEAKSYLTDNGYEILDNNLNEGADDIISEKKAVYLGYKTTDKSDEAITDMKLMNMKGGYSVQDYQKILDEQKTNIKSFFDNFIISVNEYRFNYKKGQERAIAAHEMLNLLYEDDTQQYVGDLLLNKVKEEYSDEEWAALSTEEQSKIADMTTILMQANTDAVLVIEQVIALATDDSDSLWTDRYEDAKTYDEMVEDLMESKNITAGDAAKELSSEYDADAKLIAEKIEDYKTYLSNYTDSGVTLTSTNEKLNAFKEGKEEIDIANWFTAGTHYEYLSTLKKDDISFVDLITSPDYDIENDDRCLLYPLVASLTKGQRACLDYVTLYQIVSFGINGDKAMKEAINQIDFSNLKEKQNSVYDGVDRTIFSGDVALTNDALRLQASSGKNAIQTMGDYISTASIILYSVFGVSVVATAISWGLGSGKLENLADDLFYEYGRLSDKYHHYLQQARFATDEINKQNYKVLARAYDKQASTAFRNLHITETWNNIMHYGRYVATAAMIVLMGVSLWSTYNDLKEYYNTEFTPIPSHMVNQSTNSDDEKIYTYYDAVKCNRKDKNMVTDYNKNLGDFADLNGDVGRQWVALYTTKDKAAGNPITADFVVQYNNSNIPDDKVALSMFGENVAQNLTNKKAGYTYSDGKDGIYLFYGTYTSIFAGSVFSNGIFILCGVGIIAVCGIAALIIVKSVKKKKNVKEVKADE